MKRLAAFLLIAAIFLLAPLYAVTPIWITGFEYGLAVPVVDGGGIFDIVTGTVQIQSSVKRSGDYALFFDATSAAAYFYRSVSGATTDLVLRAYILFTGTPTVARNIFIFNNAAYESFIISTDATLHIKAVVSGGTERVSTSVLTANVWSRIDIHFYSGATTGTLDWQIDGVAQTQATGTVTVGNFIESKYCDPYNTLGCGMYMDDVILSATSGDYPIGAGSVVGLRPSADATHNNAANIMEDSAGTDIDGTPAWSLLEEKPWITTADADYVRQTDIGAANYVAVNFADTTGATIHGVMAMMQYASAGTAANDGEFRIRDAAAQETVIYNGAMNVTAAAYKSTIVTPPVAGWTTANVNSLIGRIGYSGDAADDPYWLGIILEVAYVGEVSAGTYIPKVIIIQ